MHVCFSLARSLTLSKDDRPAVSVTLSLSSFFASQRVTVIYVCFSLARSLRRAGTIDLQCQSLSLRRALLRSVCLSVRLTVESVLFAGQLARKMNQKTLRKSTEERSLETPRGTQNRLKIAAWTFSGDPVACKSVPKASPERLGSVPERPRRPPGVPGESPSATQDARKGARERAEAIKIDAKSHPRKEKSSFLHAAHSQSIVEAIFRRFSSIFAFSEKSANP